MRQVSRDPAPSRLRYRLGRLWMRPSVRRVVRFGPPVLLLLGGLFYVTTSPDIRQRTSETLTSAEAFINGRAEFRVAGLFVTGASPKLEPEVVRRANVHLPASSLRLDLKAIRKNVEDIAAVERASVRIASGGSLHIDIVERRPIVLWRSEETLFVLDREGVRLGRVSARAVRPELPLLSGPGAENHVNEAQELIMAAAPIYKRLRGLERIGERRWNLVLDRDQIVMLPEFDAAVALGAVMHEHATNKLLDRDIVAVDMRDPIRPVLRLGDFALAGRGAVPLLTKQEQ